MTCDTAECINKKKGQDYFRTALDLCKTNSFTESYKYFCLAVKSDRNIGDAWVKMGLMFKESNLPLPALICLRNAHALNPDDERIYLEYGDCYFQLYDTETAKKIFTEVLENNPKSQYATYLLSSLFTDENQLDDALNLYKKLKDKTTYSNLWLGANIHLLMNNFKTGFKLYSQAVSIRSQQITPVRNIPEWKGENISDKTLYVYSEQGFGDAIQFSRFIFKAATKCKKLVLHVPEEMYSIFAKNFNRSNIEVYREGSPVTIHYQIHLSGLMAVLKEYDPHKWWTGKYFDVDITNKINVPNGTKLKVGIAWAGRSTHQHDTVRSSTFDDFFKYLSLPSVELYSLQLGHDVKFSSHDGTSGLITDLSSNIKNFADTASYLKQLDCLVCVDTSIGHLCGAMDIPCYVIIPNKILDWRWGNVQDRKTPWYPQHRIYLRENTSADSALMEIANDLKKLIENKYSHHEN